MAVAKRVRVARATVMAMRVSDDKEGKGGTGHGIDNKDGMR